MPTSKTIRLAATMKHTLTLLTTLLIGSLAELRADELPFPKNIEHVRVERSDSDPYKFLHDPAIEFHKGELFAAWYNCPEKEIVVQQFGAGPCFAEIGRALKVDGPRAGLRVGLVARRAQNVAIRELHGLVLDWAEDAFGQLLSRRPCFAAIGARFELTPPRAR